MGEVKEILLPKIYRINVLVYKEQWLKLEKGFELWYFITFAWDKQKARTTNINLSEENISEKELNITSLLPKIKKSSPNPALPQYRSQQQGVFPSL